jgi:hypothetical protein
LETTDMKNSFAGHIQKILGPSFSGRARALSRQMRYPTVSDKNVRVPTRRVGRVCWQRERP